MKNKKLVYVLLPLVAIIWGVIIYRIYVQMSDKDNGAVAGFVLPASKTADTLPDTVKLLLNYRDPFQSYSFQRQYQPKPNRGMDVFAETKQPKPEFVWPDIKFNGLIVNSQNKSKTGLFSFNGKSILVKEGDVVEGYKIIKLFNDSVTVGVNKLKKTFKR